MEKELIQKFKKILEKRKDKEVSWEEASEAASNFMGLMELLYKSAVTDHQRQERLKISPKGFHLEGKDYTCFICGGSISDEQTWYDKYGIKCLICQKAIDKKIIPTSVVKNSDSWYSKYDLETRFNIDRKTFTKFIKYNILKPRIVPSENGRPHFYLFLIKDNKDTLPPKKLTESQTYRNKNDKDNFFRVAPWYAFVDPQVVLKDYKILNYLKFTYKE